MLFKQIQNIFVQNICQMDKNARIFKNLLSSVSHRVNSANHKNVINLSESGGFPSLHCESDN